MGKLTIKVSSVRALPALPANAPDGETLTPYALIKMSGTEESRSTLGVLSATNETAASGWSFGDFSLVNAPFDPATAPTLTVEIWNNNAAIFGDQPLASWTGVIDAKTLEEGSVLLQPNWHPCTTTHSPSAPELQLSLSYLQAETQQASPPPPRAAAPEKQQKPAEQPKPAAAVRETKNSTNRSATQSTKQIDPRPPMYETNEDILHPSFRLLSTVPTHPAIALTARRNEPVSRTGVEPPGPGKYYHDLPWVKGGVKMVPSTSRARKPAELPDPPFYDVRKSWDSPRATKLTGRILDASSKGAFSPGPGVYSPMNHTMAAQLAASAASFEGTTRSTFGSTHKSPRPPIGPGPGHYAPELDAELTPRKNVPGAIMTGRNRPLMPYNTPGPGEYRVPSFVEPRHGQIPVTFKGRLPHPMDAKRADFEAAKTSHPRLPERPMKAKPRL